MVKPLHVSSSSVVHRWLCNADASALYGNHGVVLKLGAVDFNDFFNYCDPLGHSNIGQAYEAGVGNPVQENQLSEIFVYCDEDSVLRFRQCQQGSVTWIRAEVMSVKRIMPVVAELFCQSVSSASVNQKPHTSATEIVSSRSLAMTAWA